MIIILISAVYICKKVGLLAWLHSSFYVKVIVTYSTTYNHLIKPKKKELFRDLQETADRQKEPLRLLEIGPGGGTNFSMFPKNVHVVCLEPQRKFKAHLEENAKKHLQLGSLEVIQEYAQDLKMFEDNSFDVVVTTMVLCSIDDQGRILAAMKRVLKPVSIKTFTL